MGTNFFNHGFGSGPALGKIGAAVQPAAKYLRYVSPGASIAYGQGKSYNAAKVMPPSTGPYAGKVPTLADANRGYQAVAPLPAAKTVTPGNPDRAWSG